jgi:hypothetical protein
MLWEGPQEENTVATKLDANPTFARTATLQNPLQSISERRWFILGAFVGTVLVWTQVSNPVAWLAFLAGLAGMLGWILYGTARATRSAGAAAGITLAGFAGLFATGAAATLAMSYASHADAPTWTFAVIGGAVIAAALWGAWRITAPLRNDSTN